jgi:hypothetical protein
MNTFAELPNTWLSTFEIELTSASGWQYANGRQQVEVALIVQTKPGIELTQEQLESLCIVQLTADGEFIPLTTSPVPNGWWLTNEKNEYDYFPSTSLDAVNDLEKYSTLNPRAEPVHQKYFYPVTLALGGSTKKLWAKITKNSDNEYITNNIFVSDVTLRAVALPLFSAISDYVFDRELVSGSESSGMFVYEYQLYPITTPIKSGTMFPAGIIQWNDKASDESHASYVGYAGPAEADFRFNEEIVTGANFERNTTVSHNDPGKITILLQGAINIPYHSQSANTWNGPCSIGAIDANGNEHHLKIRFIGETGFENRTQLTLLDA